MAIRDIPSYERPRCRLARLGAGALSSTELVAIILASGVPNESALDIAARLLAKYGGLAGLARASFAQLTSERGIGLAKASQILAAFEIGRRLVEMTIAEKDGHFAYTPADVAEYGRSIIGFEEQEHLIVIFLNRAGRILGHHVVYKGTPMGAAICMSDIFRESVRSGCTAIVVVHNHPSGTLKPSLEDIEATRAILNAGEILGIEVWDHIIVSPVGWISIRDHHPQLWDSWRR